VSLPAADDLFRPTTPQQETPGGSDQAPAESTEAAEVSAAGTATSDEVTDADETQGGRRPSGRVRHDEKMTVYVTADELLDLEHARLSLRRTHGLAVDRGRLVREAVALALADLEANGDESAIIQRLKNS
jgi:hypothetical protein